MSFGDSKVVFIYGNREVWVESLGRCFEKFFVNLKVLFRLVVFRVCRVLSF